MSSGEKKNGLVLSGGGARSAYHIGVLAGLQDIARVEGLGNSLDYSIISGISGGAINGSYLACRADDPISAVNSLWTQWEELTLKNVFRADTFPLLSRASHLASQLGFGGRVPGKAVTELLDTAPLQQLLNHVLNFEKLRAHIASKKLHGLGITATHYGTGSSVTFFEGAPEIDTWIRSNRIGRKTTLSPDHVLASSAIPALFPPTRIQDAYYGDGAIRMSSPMSPAIHMGADRILAIGVRYFRTPQETLALNETMTMRSIRLADIAGVMLNSLFLDAIDADLERMERINRTLTLVPHSSAHPENLRRIPVLAIRPSVDLGALAKSEFNGFSWMFKHLLRGLGASDNRGSDLVSYLAFEKSYTSRLLEIGRQDALKQRADVLKWLAE